MIFDPEILKFNLDKEIQEVGEEIQKSNLQKILREIATKAKLYVLLMDDSFSYHFISFDDESNGKKETYKFIVVSPTTEPLEMETYNRYNSVSTLIGFGNYKRISRIVDDANANGIFYIFDPNSLSGMFISTKQINLYINENSVHPLSNLNNVYKLNELGSEYKKIGSFVEVFSLDEIREMVKLKKILRDISHRETLYFGIKDGIPIGFVKYGNAKRNLFIVISNSDEIFYLMDNDKDEKTKSMPFTVIDNSPETFKLMANVKDKEINIVPFNIKDLLDCIDSDCEIYYMLKISSNSLVDMFVSTDQIKQYMDDNSCFPKIIDINKLSM